MQLLKVRVKSPFETWAYATAEQGQLEVEIFGVAQSLFHNQRVSVTKMASDG